jgi:hypothetical protein
MRPQALRDATSVPIQVPLTKSRNHRTDGNLAMLWTILIILAIVALVLFILGRVRGGRGA